jgi:hypothetical protein
VFQIFFTGTLKISIHVCKYFLNFFWVTSTLFQKCSGVQISKSVSDELCLTGHGLFDESDLAIFLLICIRKLQILVQMCYIHAPLVQLFNMAYQLYNTEYFNTSASGTKIIIYNLFWVWTLWIQTGTLSKKCSGNQTKFWKKIYTEYMVQVFR